MLPGQRAPGEAGERCEGLEAGTRAVAPSAPRRDGETFFSAVVLEKNELKVPEHLPQASGVSKN